MSEHPNYFKIGLFIISATVIGVVAISVLGAGVLFKKTIMAETYFEESIQGLDTGSPVTFRGVKIGKIEDITLVSKAYNTPYRYVLVRISLFPEACPASAEELAAESPARIDKGLRVRLSMLGLTGAVRLEADYFDPKRNPPLKIDWTPRYLYIPSASSTISRASENLDRIMKSFEEINFPKMGETLAAALNILTKASGEMNLKKTGEEVRLLVTELRGTNQQIARLLDADKLTSVLQDASDMMSAAKRIVTASEAPISRLEETLLKTSVVMNGLAEKFEALSGNVPENLIRLKTTIRRLDGLIARQQQDVELTMKNMRLISENLKDFTENIKQYPSELILGSPPPRVEPGAGE
ncbi:MAG: MlaD family protein [Pseudomonadota bacterium]